jgi:hypothetical protein
MFFYISIQHRFSMVSADFKDFYSQVASTSVTLISVLSRGCIYGFYAILRTKSKYFLKLHYKLKFVTETHCIYFKEGSAFFSIIQYLGLH